MSYDPHSPEGKARKALVHIAMLEKDKEYKSLTKADLFEALKYARHVAGCALSALDGRDRA